MSISALKDFAQENCPHLVDGKCKRSDDVEPNALNKVETCLIFDKRPCAYFAEYVLATAEDQATLERISSAYKAIDATHCCEVLSAEKYPTCLFCRNQLKISACCRAKFMEIDNEPFERIPNDRGGEMDICCGDCDAEFGELHHVGCDLETCPACQGQLISCSCDKQGYFDNLDAYKAAVKQKEYEQDQGARAAEGLSHLWLPVWHKGF